MLESRTYSIAEWYGRDIHKLPVAERKRLAGINSPKAVDCPFTDGDRLKKMEGIFCFSMRLKSLL